MHFIEIATQGVRGFSASARLSLKPSYVVLGVPPGTEAPSVPVLGLCAALLFADGRGGEAVFAAPGQKAKAALTFVGNDQQTYRLLRELGGAGGLSRFNAASQSFQS